MIRIDHISFEFAAPGEDFAYSLYADWEGFCRTCFENIVEECFSEYDRDKVLHEIETIDLDLGSIPEEDFYREFPLRLKEQLLKALPSLNIPEEGQEERFGLPGSGTYCSIWNTATCKRNGRTVIST